MKFGSVSLKILIISLFFPFFPAIQPFLYKNFGLEKEILHNVWRYKKLAASLSLPAAFLHVIRHIPISLKKTIYSQKTSYELYTPEIETKISFYYIHGWAEKTYINKLGDTMKEANVIIPHFGENIKNRRFLMAFGQELDVVSILECFIESCANEEVMNIVARSRGAHALLNALCVLCSENHPLLTALKIDQNMQQKILEKMQKGSIILVVPLIDMPSTFNYHFGKIFGKAMSKYIFPFISKKRYQHRGMHALHLLKESSFVQDGGLSGIASGVVLTETETLATTEQKKPFIPKLDISIVFAKDDWVTGARKKEQDELVEALNAFNKKEVEIFYVEGGHKSPQQKEKMQELIREKIINKK